MFGYPRCFSYRIQALMCTWRAHCIRLNITKRILNMNGVNEFMYVCTVQCYIVLCVCVCGMASPLFAKENEKKVNIFKMADFKVWRNKNIRNNFDNYSICLWAFCFQLIQFCWFKSENKMKCGRIKKLNFVCLYLLALQ